MSAPELRIEDASAFEVVVSGRRLRVVAEEPGRHGHRWGVFVLPQALWLTVGGNWSFRDHRAKWQTAQEAINAACATPEIGGPS